MSKWIVAAALIVAIGLVGRADLEEAREAERRYTEMVCDGLWPDYKNRNPECE